MGIGAMCTAMLRLPLTFVLPATLEKTPERLNRKAGFRDGGSTVESDTLTTRTSAGASVRDESAHWNPALTRPDAVRTRHAWGHWPQVARWVPTGTA
jgi:hypothetical protein